MDASALRQGELIDWAVATRPLSGQERSGDLHVVQEFPGGLLVAALDGLGHGEDAAAASEAAADTLRRHPDEPPVSLVRRCHERLISTRGVAMSVAVFARNGHTMSWLGVGNVEGTLFRTNGRAKGARESLILRGGVVGYKLPRLLPTVVSVEPGDLLILATDGIERNAFDGLVTSGEPARIAEDILARFGRATDDALVLVARYRGEAS